MKWMPFKYSAINSVNRARLQTEHYFGFRWKIVSSKFIETCTREGGDTLVENLFKANLRMNTLFPSNLVSLVLEMNSYLIAV